MRIVVCDNAGHDFMLRIRALLEKGMTRAEAWKEIEQDVIVSQQTKFIIDRNLDLEEMHARNSVITTGGSGQRNGRDGYNC